MKKIKGKNKIITPIDVVYIIALALNVILYNTYSGIIIKILLFCGIMSVVMLLMYIFKYITLKEEKSKNIEKIIEIKMVYYMVCKLIFTYHIFCAHERRRK